MRRSTKILIGVFLLVSGTGIAAWLLQASKRSGLSAAIKTAVPVRTDIVDKRVISGNIMPCKEVVLTTEVSGTIDKLFVSIGDRVSKGQAIARVKVLPKSSDIERAKKELHIAQITQKEAKEKYRRSKQLFEKQLLSPEQYEAAVRAWEVAFAEADYAQKALDFVLEGYIRGAQGASNVIKSTITGVVSELPYQEGSAVVERANFKEGSPIATIADTSVILFQGKVGEMDVVHLYQGMQFEVSLMAMKGKKFPTTLTKISPKALGSRGEGSIKFAVEGTVQLDHQDRANIRAGYTATADIILAKVSNVLAVEEAWVHQENVSVQVPMTSEVAQGDSTFFVWAHENNKKVKKYVELGTSDGIYVEVKKGLTANDKIITVDDSY
ncbi:MAG: efflux RND transporter periplasmic adaptor subunit [Amoebophilaceae bacterium]|jgi:HlyD family secretion protein|nr:efflux RND transporter periplasmic adaptor subunit [Amoebophilaceae bacterium]